MRDNKNKRSLSKKEGYYFYNKVDSSSPPFLVYGYYCKDDFVIGFNENNGGGFVKYADLDSNTYLTPAIAVESNFRKSPDVNIVDVLYAINLSLNELVSIGNRLIDLKQQELFVKVNG